MNMNESKEAPVTNSKKVLDAIVLLKHKADKIRDLPEEKGAVNLESIVQKITRKKKRTQ